MESNRSSPKLLSVILVFCLTCSVSASSEMFLEPGIFEFDVSLSPASTEDGASLEGYEFLSMQKSMYANSEIGIEVLNCSSNPPTGCEFTLEWTVRQSDCDGVYRALFQETNQTTARKTMEAFYNNPNCFILLEEHTISFVKSVEIDPNPSIDCSDEAHAIHDKLNDLKGAHWECSSRSKIEACNKKKFCGPKPEENKSDTSSESPAEGAVVSPASGAGDPPADDASGPPADGAGAPPPAGASTASPTSSSPASNGNPKNPNNGDGDGVSSSKSKKRRAAEDPPQENGKTTTPAPEDNPNKPMLKGRVVLTNQKDGRFIFIIYLTSKNAKQLNVSLRVRMKSPHGYLSATQYPLLPFYGIMCALYSILGLVWIILLFRQWKDLMRIQFWIAVVILLGLIEKAAFVAEYDRHNNSGTNTSAGIFFAEELSVLKRTMARMLVIVVSLGYGITRPRLGRDLNWLMGAGVLFFFLSTVEAYFRIFKVNKSDGLIALLPLSVLDAVLCWWIFRSLVDTSRTLRLRRNLVKLWLYRHFTNALIFCVVAAVIFLIWSLRAHRMNKCVKHWNEIWVDDAYWHILFGVILVVIVILFRPTANNQRYAYSVLSDAVDDDESKEPMMNDAFESVKMRNVHSNKPSGQSKEVDDLQWVEDNIPAAVADAALGAFDDSEEELITNVERNKME